MPVHRPPAEHDHVGPYARLSPSQVNLYRSCPRQWYYEKVLRLKFGQIPVLFVGRCVEEVVCRVLRESPGFILSTAPTTAFEPTPLDSEGKPNREQEHGWPMQMMMPVRPQHRPQSIDALKEWVISRVEEHFEPVFQMYKELWMQDERREGDWSDINPESCRAMILHAFDFHLEEVQHCMKDCGNEELERWRSGDRLNEPAPDGFPYCPFKGGHPLAQNGSITLTEAWEITRPWFVDPDAQKFVMSTVHPNYWFQGEYDLVYRWGGRVKIVDLKASVGKGDRSGDYIDQLQMYAMLWKLTHNDETVDSLQIWYLGHPSIKHIPIPTNESLDEMANQLELLWNLIKKSQPNIQSCPPTPAALRGFAAGGQPIDPPDRLRCDDCSWADICEGSQQFQSLEIPTKLQFPGQHHTTSLVKLDSIDGRVTIGGEIFSISNARKEFPPEILIQQGHFSAKTNIASTLNQHGLSTYPDELKKGEDIIIVDAIPSMNWKQELVLKIDPFAQIYRAKDASAKPSSIGEINIRRHVGGRFVYKTSKSGVGKNGKPWTRLGLVIIDETGSIKIEGWAADWGPQYDLLEAGDVVAVGNIGLDGWANEIKGTFDRNSRLHIVNRVRRI